jgi:hypothetical protein
MSSVTRLTQPKKRNRDNTQATGLPVGGRANRPAHPYVYIHYAQSWSWVGLSDEKGTRYGWLPRPKRIVGQPGCNGVTDPHGGEVTIENMMPALNRHTAKGAKVIHPTDPLLGDYLYYDEFYDTQTGGKWFIEPGQEAVVLPTKEILWNSDDVIPAVMNFRRHLRDSGLALPFLREFYLKQMATERQKLSRLYEVAGKNPGLQHRVEAQEGRIEMMEEDYKVYTGILAEETAPVVPKRRATRRAKPAPTETTDG